MSAWLPLATMRLNLISTPSLRSSGHHHIDLPAAATGTHQSLSPIEHGHSGAVSGSHLGGIRLDLAIAFLAPDDQAHTSRGGDAERHWWAAIGFHGCEEVER